MWDGDSFVGGELWDETGLGRESSIVEGWALCNGNNGTPNLSKKFIVGHDETDVSYNTIGKNGGEASVRLTGSHIPLHSHSFNVATDGFGGTVGSFYSRRANVVGSEDKILNVFTSSSGGSEAHDNIPPYRALVYIKKISEE